MERTINIGKGSETRIVKKSNFFSRNFFLLFGSLFLLLSLFNIFSGEWNFLFVGYLLIGFGYVLLHFKYKKKYGVHSGYIAWDEQKILLREPQQPPNIYTWGEVDDIRISKNHLTIKSGDAKGLMMDLKGFSEGDIELLRQNFEKNSLPDGNKYPHNS